MCVGLFVCAGVGNCHPVRCAAVHPCRHPHPSLRTYSPCIPVHVRNSPRPRVLPTLCFTSPGVQRSQRAAHRQRLRRVQRAARQPALRGHLALHIGRTGRRPTPVTPHSHAAHTPLIHLPLSHPIHLPAFVSPHIHLPLSRPTHPSPSVTPHSQYGLVTYGGDFVRTSPLTLEIWGKCFLLGSLSFPVGGIMRLFPVHENEADFAAVSPLIEHRGVGAGMGLGAGPGGGLVRGKSLRHNGLVAGTI